MIEEKIDVKITPTQESRINQVDWENLPFGKIFSDHMLEMNYINGKWSTPEIKPFSQLSLHPATSAIHYGQSVFEGMKAVRGEAGDVLLFRPEKNAQRFKESCERMCMATIEPDIFVQLVKQIVDVDRDWVPQKEGYSLYIRPFMFATDDYIGIKPSGTYKFLIFTCPVGHYYSKPVKVKIEEYYSRAVEGGVGRAKTSGNYAASLYPAKKAQEEGFDQLIWTDAKEHKYIEESGTMNVVFEIDGKLVTPSEESDTILKGITKRSVLEIAQSMGIEVEERKVTVEEVITAIKEGRLTDAFGAGTAATIAPIQTIGYRGELYEVPMEPRETSNKIKEYLVNLKTGKIKDPFGWIIKV